MKKYLVKLIFNVITADGAEASQFDEQFRIVESHELENAFYKARNIGKKEEESFVDAQNRLVTWKFIDVAEVYPLEHLGDGEQVYSSTHETKDAQSFISYIRRKSMEIQAKSLTFA